MSKKWILISISIACLVLFSFIFYGGMKKAEVDCVEEKIVVIEKEKEVIRYVDREKEKIYSAPNATRADVLKLMQNNEL